MFALLVVGLFGGIAVGLAVSPAGFITSVMLAPVGASIMVAIVACLRNLDTNKPENASRIGFGRRLARHL